MQLPELQVGRPQNLMTTVFKGYNHNPKIADGEMYDMKNLSGRSYPLMDQRPARAWTSWDAPGNVPKTLHGISGRDDLILIRGKKVFYNLYEVRGIELSEAPEMLPKKIVSMGAYVCIWPDKKYFNTIDTSDYGDMAGQAAIDVSSAGDVSAMMCRGDGTDYGTTEITISNTAPENPFNGQLWMDISGANHVLKQYDSASDAWIEVATTYVKIQGTGIGHDFRMYDAVNISGMITDSTSVQIQAQVDALNGSKIIYHAGEDYIVIAGLLSQGIDVPVGASVTVERPIPDLDYVCESNNRLWGCKYGIENGAVVNEIRASKLGDFRNWSCFMGLSTDSYTASVGSDGPFTGAVTQRSYPIFFKEDCIHRVSGQTPATFSINTTVCRGIQDGSWRSAVVTNEMILYKSRGDIMMYDGSSTPTSISEQLGDILYSDARAGALAGKYYISMKDRQDNWVLFVYDSKNSAWYKEDSFRALGFGTVEDELYAIDEENNRLVAMTGNVGETVPESTEETGSETAETEEETEETEEETEETEEETEETEEETESGTQETDEETNTGWHVEDEIPWEAVFGLFGTDYYGTKYLSRFNLRMQMDEGSEAELSMQYDHNGHWDDCGTIRGRNLRTFLVPVIPRRCDHLQIRLKGKGRCRVYSIGRVMEVGGDG